MAIARCIPRDGDDPGRCLFDLARDVAGAIPDANEQYLRGYVARWVAACRKANAPVSGFDDAWAIFKRKWPTVRAPSGRVWRDVLERSETVAVPAGIGEKLAPIFRLFVALHEIGADEDGVIFVSYRDLAKATGLDHKTVSRYVARLGGLGHIELVESGDNIRKRGGRANRYRFHNPPIEGGAPWNSHPSVGPGPIAEGTDLDRERGEL